MAATKKFKFLEIVTAEAAFQAFGKNLNNLFENCALAVTETMTNIKKIKPKTKKAIALKDKDLKALLVAFLNEIVYLKDAEQLLFSKYKVRVTQGKNKIWNLSAKLAGQKINPAVHQLRADIKAVTWHMFALEQKGKGWTARIVLDV